MKKEKVKDIEVSPAESKKGTGLKNLTKSSVWDLQENDVFRMLESGAKDAEIRENLRHYVDIIRSAFMMEELKRQGSQTEVHKVGIQGQCCQDG